MILGLSKLSKKPILRGVEVGCAIYVNRFEGGGGGRRYKTLRPLPSHLERNNGHESRIQPEMSCLPLEMSSLAHICSYFVRDGGEVTAGIMEGRRERWMMDHSSRGSSSGEMDDSEREWCSFLTTTGWGRRRGASTPRAGGRSKMERYGENSRGSRQTDRGLIRQRLAVYGQE